MASELALARWLIEGFQQTPHSLHALLPRLYLHPLRASTESSCITRHNSRSYVDSFVGVVFTAVNECRIR